MEKYQEVASIRTPEQSTPPLQRFLKLRQVSDATGYSRSWIWLQIRNKKFPPPLKIGRSSRWPASVIADWQAQQIEHSYKQAA